MQVYVNYFDKEFKLPEDKPTIGLILYPRSNEGLVQYFIGDTPKSIYSLEYRLHLPSEQELSQELKRELFFLEQQIKDEKEEGV